MTATAGNEARMRLGVAWIPCSNANYRAVFPLRAMARRGHEVIVPAEERRRVNVQLFTGCDVVHVYRRFDEETRRMMSALASQGTAITYDNDDLLEELPPESPNYQLFGASAADLFADSVQTAAIASVFTTTTETLAGRYRRAGVKRVEVIPNSLSPDADRPRRPHDGIVIGWVAGTEHLADTARIPIEAALQRLIDNHPEVSVESMGVKLRLSERYRHDELVMFDDVPGRIGGFDIGIAPLADIPFNLCRSDIKLKEYAASGVPWLASRVGPYLGLGEQEGGRLVPDDGWYEALVDLVTDAAARARLARNAEAWARKHMIDAVADRWEAVFAEAMSSVRRSATSAVSVGGRHYAIQMPARAVPKA